MSGGFMDTGITVYSQWKQGRDSRWVRTEMCRAGWYGGAGASFGTGGPRAGGHWIVRIPEAAMAAGYVGPDAWRDLIDPDGQWTLQPGDVIAKGHGLPEVIEGISEITGTVAECFVVDSVRDNRRGAGQLRHLRAEGSG